jgi:hypothetical protein
MDTIKSVHGHNISVNAQGGKSSKLDADWTLLPDSRDLREIVKVLTENCDEHGGDYPRGNWKKLSPLDNYNHAIDHIMTSLEFFNDEDHPDAYDELTHAACRILFILFQLRH